MRWRCVPGSCSRAVSGDGPTGVCTRIDQPSAGHVLQAPDASKIDGGARVSNESHIVIEDVDAVYDAAEGDLTALSKISTVVFEPAADGIVTSFDIVAIAGDTASKQVSISAPVRLPDGRTVMKNYAITIQRGMITAISESVASPSIPRP